MYIYMNLYTCTKFWVWLFSGLARVSISVAKEGYEVSVAVERYEVSVAKEGYRFQWTKEGYRFQ
jgi:hypothetical protein